MRTDGYSSRSCGATWPRRESCVLKVSGKDIKEFRGPAKCYDGENTAYDGIQNGERRLAMC